MKPYTQTTGLLPHLQPIKCRPFSCINSDYNLKLNRAVWQDVPATIHRTPVALEACGAFKTRIPHDIQAPKMAAIWPIENVWAILKIELRQRSLTPKYSLKKIISVIVEGHGQ